MFTAAEQLRLVEAIYAGILDDSAWEVAIGVLCRALGGDSATVVLQDTASNRTSAETFVDIDPSYRSSYAEFISLPDMAVPSRALATCLAAGALTAADVARLAPGLTATRFHAEWLRPQRIDDYVIAPLAPSPKLIGGVFIARSRRDVAYDGDEVAVFRALQPHLLRVVQARLRLKQADNAARYALDALDRVQQAVLLVGPDATLVHVNLAAEATLRDGDGMSARHSVLGCDRAEDTATLRRLVGEASEAPAGRPGGTLAVGRRSGRRPLSVLVAPLHGERPAPLGPPATAIVLIANPDSKDSASGMQLRKLYGLTVAEARTAEALLDHQRLVDMAAKFGVTLSTVRTLLQRVFQKTETHSQAELVHLMLAHRLPTAPASAS